MWRYFISIIFVATSVVCKLQAQDTITFPIRHRVGLDLYGASKIFYEQDMLDIEAFFSADLNEKTSAIIFAGVSDYIYPRYRDATFLKYNLNVKGIYAKTGFDFNMLHAKKAEGKYFAGVGLRYGISNYSFDLSEINFENYWGRYQTSIPQKNTWAHFFEVAFSARVAVVKNISLGWSANLKKMISAGVEKDMRSVYVPGYGDTSKSFGFSINYSIIFNISHKEKRVIVYPRFADTEDDFDINQ